MRIETECFRLHDCVCKLISKIVLLDGDWEELSANKSNDLASLQNLHVRYLLQSGAHNGVEDIPRARKAPRTPIGTAYPIRMR